MGNKDKLLHLNHTLFVDALRGSMVIKVLVLHFIICFYPAIFYGVENTWVECTQGFAWETIIGKSPLFQFINGSFAVYQFWLISGFVLGIKLKNSCPIKVNIRDLLARLEYFVITVGAALLFSYILLCLGLNFNGIVGEEFGNGALTGYLYPMQPEGIVSLIKDWIYVFYRGSSFYNVTLWFMKYAFWGSIFTYVVMFLMNKARKWQFQIVLLLFITIGIVFLKRYNYLPFIFGIFMAMYGENIRYFVMGRNKLLVFIFLTLLLILGIACGGYPINHDIEKGFYNLFPKVRYEFYYVIGASIIFWVYYISDFYRQLIEIKPLIWIYRNSFAIYLLHFPIIMTLGMRLFYLCNVTWKINYHVAAMITILITSAVIFWVASITTRYVKPVLKKQQYVNLILCKIGMNQVK